MINPTLLLIAFGALLACVVITVVFSVVSRRKETPNKLTGVVSLTARTAPHGIIGDFVDITIESAEYGSDEYTRPALDGLVAILRDERTLRPDGAKSFGINSRMLIGDEKFLPGVYKHLKVTFSAKLHEGKELTFRPGDRVIIKQASPGCVPESST